MLHAFLWCLFLIWTIAELVIDFHDIWNLVGEQTFRNLSIYKSQRHQTQRKFNELNHFNPAWKSPFINTNSSTSSCFHFLWRGFLLVPPTSREVWTTHSLVFQRRKNPTGHPRRGGLTTWGRFIFRQSTIWLAHTYIAPAVEWVDDDDVEWVICSCKVRCKREITVQRSVGGVQLRWICYGRRKRAFDHTWSRSD